MPADTNKLNYIIAYSSQGFRYWMYFLPRYHKENKVHKCNIRILQDRKVV